MSVNVNYKITFFFFQGENIYSPCRYPTLPYSMVSRPEVFPRKLENKIAVSLVISITYSLTSGI